VTFALLSFILPFDRTPRERDRNDRFGGAVPAVDRATTESITIAARR
jgi:hypothetical protein